jgi:hypothetical protein
MSEFKHYESGHCIKRDNFYDQNSKQKLNNTSYFQEIIGNFSMKKFLLYNIEDILPSRLNNNDLEKHHDSWVGRSREIFDVLIIRDPFNLFASRLKAGDVLTGIDNVDEIKSLWKYYAKEYLDETNFLSQNKITINFNQWFSSSHYRNVLADKLRLEFTDRGLEAVRFGSWSSFDGSKFDGRAQEMQVLQRWKDFSDHFFYKMIFDDKELLDLSEKIFGDIEGTEILTSSK